MYVSKREVEIIINKGMTSFFAYPLPRGALFFCPKIAVFCQITGRKTLKNIFNAHECYIFSIKLHSLTVQMTYHSSISDLK